MRCRKGPARAKLVLVLVCGFLPAMLLAQARADAPPSQLVGNSRSSQNTAQGNVQPAGAPGYSTPSSPDEWLFRFQTLAAAIVGLMGASVAVLAVVLTHILTRARERRDRLTRQIEVAGHLISLIGAENRFADKALYNTGVMGLVLEVPDLKMGEISEWLESDVQSASVSLSELAQFWRGAYEETKGFPSPITDIMTFILWAAGRSAFFAAIARQRGRGLTSTELLQAARRVQHLLTAIGIASSQLQRELVEFIDKPRKYGRPPLVSRVLNRFRTAGRFSQSWYRVERVLGRYRPEGNGLIPRDAVNAALSDRFLTEALQVIGSKPPRSEEWIHRPGASPPEDREPRVLRLILPASVADEFDHTLTRFKLHEFARHVDSNDGTHFDGGYVAFLKRLLDCWSAHGASLPNSQTPRQNDGPVTAG